jgi:hypothetical protein
MPLVASPAYFRRAYLLGARDAHAATGPYYSIDKAGTITVRPEYENAPMTAGAMAEQRYPDTMQVVLPDRASVPTPDCLMDALRAVDHITRDDSAWTDPVHARCRIQALVRPHTNAPRDTTDITPLTRARNCLHTVRTLLHTNATPPRLKRELLRCVAEGLGEEAEPRDTTAGERAQDPATHALCRQAYLKGVNDRARWQAGRHTPGIAELLFVKETPDAKETLARDVALREWPPAVRSKPDPEDPNRARWAACTRPDGTAREVAMIELSVDAANGFRIVHWYRDVSSRWPLTAARAKLFADLLAQPEA